MEPTVSIIVPVYNAQDYLERCVDSILNQEYTELEIFLINDGSTDRSGEICESYRKKDSRIHVIHKDNTGVSDSRNMAIRQAKGTYLQFADSDDWMAPQAVKLMVRKANETGCDMVIADFYRVIGDRVSHKGDIEEDKVMTKEEFASHMMERPSDFYYGALWNKLYRKDIVDGHRLSMNKEISWCEDFMFNLEYLRYARSICALQVPIYYYVKRKGSLVSQSMNISKVIQMKLMVFEYYNNFYKHVLDEEDYEKNRLQVYRFLIDSAKDGIILPSILSGAKKLGTERNIIYREAIQEDGILSEAYRSRKLMEHYLEPVALKHGLTISEVSFLLYVFQSDGTYSRKRLADILGLSRGRLTSVIQKLSLKGFIKTEEQKEKKGEEKKIRILLQPEAELLLPEFQIAMEDYGKAMLAGFSQEEIEDYIQMSRRIKENIQKILK